MKNFWLFSFLLLSLCTAEVSAQLDSIQQLPEVVLTDSKLVHFSKGFKLETISDSLVQRNASALTETLRYISAIYFKENGFGMVSSPSFRGTNAAQTAVIWNGININSVFTGQTDFNTLSPINYREISVRSGGGAVQYGSGAVGGSVHLNDGYTFKPLSETRLAVEFGSFGTFAGNAQTTQTWDNHYLNVGVDVISSENDYDYIGKNRKNEHGAFSRFTAKVNEARKLRKGVASWNSEYSYNNRDFSGSLTTTGKDAYIDIATRNLWQLHQHFGIFNVKGRVAHLFEQYNYFPDGEKPTNSGAKANTFLGAVESEVMLRQKIRINGKVEYSYVSAKGNQVGENDRPTLAAVFLINHKVSEKLNYGINLRQEFLNHFENPLLFSLDATYSFSEYYALRLNGSKNFRVPTFNDLYWYAGGNLNLKPETSYQLAVGQEITLGKIKADVALFYIDSKDLIKWVPGNGGLWQPLNIAKTQNYGVEVALGYYQKFAEKHRLDFNANYSYTLAEDREKEKQLIYVPFHKATGTLDYGFGPFSAYVQALFTGQAFTTTDHSEWVDSSTVFNIGAQCSLPIKPLVTFGGRIKNVLNVYYENVAYRPMPSRNFQIFLTFNI